MRSVHKLEILLVHWR